MSFISTKETGRQRTDWSRRLCGACHFGIEKLCQRNQDKLIEGARGSEIIEQESTETMKRKMVEARMSEWKEKPLHGQYLRETEDVKSIDTWLWLREGKLKKQTESLLTAAQDQALRTNIIKAKIDKTSDCSLCRLCKEADETVTHIASQCSKLAQLEYFIFHFFSFFISFSNF